MRTLLFSLLTVFSLAACSDKPLDTVDAAAADDLASADSAATDPAELLKAGVVLYNNRRLLAGLSPVSVDPVLNDGCEAHVAYMAGEAKVVHDEVKESPFYDDLGALAGPNSVIAGNVENFEEAINHWFDGLYHRIGIHDPGVTSIGVAFQDGYACMDVFSTYGIVDDHPPVQYPAHQQDDVPTSFNAPGPVNPLPTSVSLPSGPIVSLMFPTARELGQGFMATVIDKESGAALAAFTRLPREAEDPYADFHLNTVAVTPLQPLKPVHTYGVIMDGEVDGELFHKEWEFTTREE